jgi:hypothetical protein
MKILLENNRSWADSRLKPFADVRKIEELKRENWSYHVVIGSFAFAERALEYGATRLCDYSDFLYSRYAPDFGEELLNSDYILLPACELPRLKYRVLGSYSEDCKIFVRPEGGDKLFDGQILDIEEFDSFTKYGKELIVIAKPQKILGEWRFVVSEHEILGVSLYRYQGNLVSAASCPPEMTRYVEALIKKRKWADPLVVMDVAQLYSGEFRLIECNSFSCSGQYGMEPSRIVEFIGRL